MLNESYAVVVFSGGWEGETSPGSRRLKNYLRQLSHEADIKHLAWDSWMELNKMMKGLMRVPDAAHGPNGEIFYAWDQEQHHLSLEVLPTGEREFFYRNRGTRQLWSLDHATGEVFTSNDLKEKLALFV